MPNYLLAYHGGKKPESPEEGAKGMAKWKAWVDGLGGAAVNPGTPLGKFKTVSASGVSDDGGSNPMLGFSIVKADSMDAALEMAKECPHVELGGTLEVAEMMEMPK
jgi:hypothetical protein